MTGPTSTEPRPIVTVSEHVFSILRAEILGGTLSPGDALPGERPLAERLGCNRHAIREAVKRLQQAGLVEVTQGGATRVLDWRATGGLDLLTQLAGAGAAGTVDPELGASVLPSVLEMRACIGADAAGRCALRAPDVAPRLAARSAGGGRGRRRRRPRSPRGRLRRAVGAHRRRVRQPRLPPRVQQPRRWRRRARRAGPEAPRRGARRRRRAPHARRRPRPARRARRGTGGPRAAHHRLVRPGRVTPCLS